MWRKAGAGIRSSKRLLISKHKTFIWTEELSGSGRNPEPQITGSAGQGRGIVCGTYFWVTTTHSRNLPLRVHVTHNASNMCNHHFTWIDIFHVCTALAVHAGKMLVIVFIWKGGCAFGSMTGSMHSHWKFLVHMVMTEKRSCVSKTPNPRNSRYWLQSLNIY